jgi:hypothetical protein
MSFENKSKNDRFTLNKKFLSDFHKNVLSSGKQGQEGKKTVTMKISSIGTAADKHYLLPRYDPNTGKVIKDDKTLLKKFLPFIESGKIKSYSTYQEAEADRKIIRNQILKNNNGN